jgi:aminopeptidase N
MVGSNETYRALLDEGFTQFIDSWCCTVLDGQNVVHWQYASKYVQRYKEEDRITNVEVYNRYMPYAASGNDETVIDTHSDYFGSALRHGGGYGEVYSKTATMLYNLQYVLGDSLFEAAFSHYFNQWKFCHPYVEDFRTSIIQFTHVDLNWFFDQWLTTAKTIDYGIRYVREADSANTYIIKFRRYGRGQSPIDFTVTSNDGTKHNYYIPNNWWVKPTDATVLPRWIGWDKLCPTYKARVVLPNGISDVQIDTTHRLADANMLNNSMSMPIDFRFDSRIYNTPSWEHYEMRARPDIWYNGYDGFKFGMYIGGDYLNMIHQFDLTFSYNSGLFQSQLPAGAEINKFDYLSVLFNYKTATNKFIRNSSVNVGGRHLDGFDEAHVGFDVADRDQKNKFSIQYKIMSRADSTDLNYLLYKTEWVPGKINAVLNLGYDHPYTYHHGTGDIKLNLRSSSFGSDYDYQSLNICVLNKNDLGKININTRTFFQIGTGTNWAKESMLYAAGANPEEMMDNKYTRSVAFFPTDWATFGNDVNHFQAGGGLDLRGYAGYLMPTYDWYRNVNNTYKGTSGYAENVEVEFQELFGFIGRAVPKVSSVIGMSTYLFGDIGGINFNKTGQQLAFGDFRADAGVGAALTIKRFPPLQLVKPLTIRFDMPLFLNSTPAANPDYIQMRWIVGINRAF